MTRLFYVLALFVSVSIMPLFAVDHAHATDNRDSAKTACEPAGSTSCAKAGGSDQLDQFKKHEVQCRFGKAAACFDAARMLEDVWFETVPPRRMVELYNRACNLKARPISTKACIRLAEMYEQGAGVRKSAFNAKIAFKRACKLGDRASCANVGEPIMTDRLGELEEKCHSKKIAAACFEAGRVHESKGSQTASPGKLAQLYNAACNLRDLEACLRLVDVHQQGLGVRRSAFAATRALARACKLGSTISCVKAGEAYFNGFGMQRDRRRAAEYLHYGCDANVVRACRHLVVIYQDPTSRVTNRQKASELLRKLCRLGDSLSCNRVRQADNVRKVLKKNKAPTPKTNHRTIKRATFMRDFELAKQHLKDFHPNLYVHRTPKQLHRIWKKIEAIIPEKLNRADAATYLQMLMASACDEHTTVRWKKELGNSTFKSALPFELFVKENKLYIDAEAGYIRDWPITKIGDKSDREIIDFLSMIQTADGCPKGRMQFTRILSNGIPANAMLANFIETGPHGLKIIQSSETSEDTYQQTKPFQEFSLYLINARYWGFRTSNRTTAANYGFKSASYSPTNAPFAVFYNADNSLAYVYVDSFRVDDRFREILDKKMRELVKRNPARVIIDLSKNPGGHLDTAQRFASYFLRTGSRLGSTVRSTIKHTNKSRGLEWDRWEVENSVKETKTFLRKWGRKKGNVRQIAFRKKSFGNKSTNAELSVIVSPATHSAATFVSTTLKRLNNAKIYGYIGDLSMEKSCVAPQSHFLLPNTKLRIEIPFVCFSRNPKAKTRGNIADAKIPSLEGIRSLTGLITKSVKLALDDATRKVAAN